MTMGKGGRRGSKLGLGTALAPGCIIYVTAADKGRQEQGSSTGLHCVDQHWVALHSTAVCSASQQAKHAVFKELFIHSSIPPLVDMRLQDAAHRKMPSNALSTDRCSIEYAVR